MVLAEFLFIYAWMFLVVLCRSTAIEASKTSKGALLFLLGFCIVTGSRIPKKRLAFALSTGQACSSAAQVQLIRMRSSAQKEK